MPVWVMPFVIGVVFLVDALIAAGAFVLAFNIRQGESIFAGGDWSTAFRPYAGVMLFAVLATVVMLAYNRIYRFFGAFSFIQEATKIFNAVIFSSLLTIAWAFLFRGIFSFQEFSYSRSVFLLNFAFAFVGFVGFHWLLRLVQVRFRNRGINLIPTIIVGTNSEASRTIEELEEQNRLYSLSLTPLQRLAYLKD